MVKRFATKTEGSGIQKSKEENKQKDQEDVGGRLSMIESRINNLDSETENLVIKVFIGNVLLKVLILGIVIAIIGLVYDVVRDNSLRDKFYESNETMNSRLHELDKRLYLLESKKIIEDDDKEIKLKTETKKNDK